MYLVLFSIFEKMEQEPVVSGKVLRGCGAETNACLGILRCMKFPFKKYQYCWLALPRPIFQTFSMQCALMYVVFSDTANRDCESRCGLVNNRSMGQGKSEKTHTEAERMNWVWLLVRA